MVAWDSNRVVISPDGVLKYLLAAIAVLVAADAAAQWSKYFLGHDHLMGLVRLTDLNGEANLPAWYSSATLLACGAVVAALGAVNRSRRDRTAWYWFGLALIFVYLSLDESASLHEDWGDPIRARFGLDGYLRYTWVIPGAVVVGAVAATYFRFLWRLPSAIFRSFALAGFLYVGGAIGVEMLAANHQSLFGRGNFGFSLLVILEESAEMFGVAVFLHGAMRHLAAECALLHVEIEQPANCVAPALRVPAVAGPIGVSV